MIAAALAALAVALAAAPAEPFQLEELPAAPGRPRVLLAPREGATATLAIRFATGSADDPEGRSGLTRVAQHALLVANAAVDPEQLTIALHAAAARLTVSTGIREASFVLTAPARDFGALAATLADAVLAPRLDGRRLRTALDRTLHDVRQPGRGNDLATYVSAALADDLRSQNDPFGDRGQIEQIEAEDVREALARPLSPANATIVVTGAFDRAAIVRALSRLRGGRPAAPARVSTLATLTTINPKSRELALVAMPFQAATAQQVAAVRTLVALFEDLLWRDLRAAASAYALDVVTVHAPPIDVVALVVPAPAAAGDVRRSLDLLLDTVRQGRYSDATLQRARAAALARLRRDDGRSDALAAALLAGGAGWHGAAAERALAELDRAPFQDTVARWLAQDARASSGAAAEGRP